MKKKLIAGILAGSMLAALAGCGGGETDPGAADSPSGSGSGGVIEITIPSYKTGENVGAVFFEPQGERFTKLYEGKYKINL